MKTRVLYMIVGAGLILLGQLLAPLLWTNAVGQEEAAEEKATHFNQLTCNSLEVLDAEGRRQLSLFSTDHGGFAAIWDKSGALAAVVGADERGGTVIVRSPKDGSRGALRIEDGGALWLLGADGSKQAAVEATADGGGVSLYSADETLRGAWLALPVGAELSLLGSDGERRASVSVSPDEAGSVRVYGADGERTGVMPEF